MVWQFPKDNEGRIWPVRPDGQLHVPIGGIANADGGWGGPAPTIGDIKTLQTVLKYNTVRVLSGEIGSPISHKSHPRPAETTRPPLSTIDAVRRHAELGMCTQIHPTHNGWQGYNEVKSQDAIWRRWAKGLAQDLEEEGLSEWTIWQVFPEPGSYDGGEGIRKWPTVLDYAKLLRSYGYTGLISLPDHMWGQHGPDGDQAFEGPGITDFDPGKSGPTLFAALVRAYLERDDQVVVNCESYGQSWASGLNRADRSQHCLDYVDALAEIGLYVYVSDWDYRGAYRQAPVDGRTLFSNRSAQSEYGAQAWADAALERGNIGLLAWSLTPHQGNNDEMYLVHRDDGNGNRSGWASTVAPDRSNLTYAGNVLDRVARMKRPGRILTPPTEPPDGDQDDGDGKRWIRRTIRIDVTAATTPVTDVVEFTREETPNDTPLEIDVGDAIRPPEAAPEAVIEIREVVGGSAVLEAGVVVFTPDDGFVGEATVSVRVSTR